MQFLQVPVGGQHNAAGLQDLLGGSLITLCECIHMTPPSAEFHSCGNSVDQKDLLWINVETAARTYVLMVVNKFKCHNGVRAE